MKKLLKVIVVLAVIGVVIGGGLYLAHPVQIPGQLANPRGDAAHVSEVFGAFTGRPTVSNDPA